MSEPQKSIKEVTELLGRLKDAGIYYRLSDPTGAIMVEVAVPGERWEIEFHNDGEVGVEKFISEGTIGDESLITELFERFTD